MHCRLQKLARYTFCFLLFWPLHFYKVQSQIGRPSSVGMISFCQVPSKGYRLNSTVGRQLYALSGIDCILLCIKNDQCCRSVNYRKNSEYDGKENCELLYTVPSERPGYLKKDEKYDFHLLPQLNRTFDCRCSPCRNNGVCDEQSKNCSCMPGFIGHECQEISKNCGDLLRKGETQDGVYKIDPDNRGTFEVRCDLTTKGGGWTVFQKRIDGSVDFYRNWTEYKNGFGNLDGEFWLGLDKINRLSLAGLDNLRVDFEDFKNKTFFAEYNTFSVSNETNKYKLRVGGYTGDAGDSLSYHNGQQFSTPDEDNDLISHFNCADRSKAGWWYKQCYLANLNGLYQGGIRWGTRRYRNRNTFKKAEMKMRVGQH